MGEPRFLADASLEDLRARLASGGLPSRDVAVPCRTVDLSTEDGLLRLSEHIISANGSGPAVHRPHAMPGSNAAPAGVVGPVVLHRNARVDPTARIVGPAVIGAGASIGANALVAQCLVAPGVDIAANTVVVRRALFQQPSDEAVDDFEWSDSEWTAENDLGISFGDDSNRKSVYPLFKRAVDATAALCGLIVLSPLLLLIAILIKLESKGTVLYRDVRETMGGRQFHCWKFRTMCEGADEKQRELLKQNEVDGPQFKIEGDPRITRIGRWLRKISFDELPQLVNVLRGDMSIVGPRPSPFRENQICIPWRNARLSVRAGITGLWQVCREDRLAGDFHQWIHYDLLYVQHMSFAVDLKILLATVFTLGGMGRVPAGWIIPGPKASQIAREQVPARVYDIV
jgi:lipopolysaccharide/colanic/teichoic acid biosynthesis glycosyltransferase